MSIDIAPSVGGQTPFVGDGDEVDVVVGVLPTTTPTKPIGSVFKKRKPGVDEPVAGADPTAGGTGAPIDTLTAPVATEALPEAAAGVAGTGPAQVKVGAAAPLMLKSKRQTRDADDLEDDTLPIQVVIEFHRGLSKTREVEVLARTFIEANFSPPGLSYLFVMKWRDGIASEMQLAGGRAYLPEVLAYLDANPNGVCAVAMSNRVMTVRYDPDVARLECLLLPDGQLPPEGAFHAMPTTKMSPYDQRGFVVLVLGFGLAVAGMLALGFALGQFFLDTRAWALPHLIATSTRDLPVAQAGRMRAALARADCVAKLEYRDARWAVTTGFANGDSCSQSRSAVPVASIAMSEPAAVAPTPGIAPMAPPADMATGAADAARMRGGPGAPRSASLTDTTMDRLNSLKQAVGSDPTGLAGGPAPAIAPMPMLVRVQAAAR